MQRRRNRGLFGRMDWGRDRTGLELPWRDGSRNHHRDNNLRAAYLHVVADAASSVLAIAALVVSDHPLRLRPTSAGSAACAASAM